ncbi:uncharacterized protein FTOL_13898 [Fusarium torulosum]|uniref:Uncharacterized protein n=1 Tax=Fusarium torulosum TaxID=33205 RepID=A0AAE8MML3_9HYPO|nr:uncharacterized protein FTOL_13898 [Fusarium torulosum]
MSSGVGIGDILAAIQLANGIRKTFLGAPEQFSNISNKYDVIRNTDNDTNHLVWQSPKSFDHLIRYPTPTQELSAETHYISCF